MRESASRADFDSSAVFIFIHRISRAVLKMIKRTVTEEAVELFNTLVAGIIPACFIRKELF